MKKCIFLSLMILAITKIIAQPYQISFAGSGASTTIDSVKVENLTQCTKLKLNGSDILNLTTVVGINSFETVQNKLLNVYPNPMSDNCFIDFNSPIQGNGTIELFDISGKKIIQSQQTFVKGHQTFNLSGISSGVYTIKVELNNVNYTAKLTCNNKTSGLAEIKKTETSQNNYIDNKTNAGSKNMKSVIDMQYNYGDRIKFTAYAGAGVYRTVYMLVPTSNQTVTFNFVACTDADNNHYSVVQIGTRTWMAENLRTTKFLNANVLTNVTNNTSWKNLSTEAFCYYNNDINNANAYGVLYNWYAVNDTRGICPSGWHVATNSDWNQTEFFLDGTVDTTISTGYTGTDQGGQLKSKCDTLWGTSNIGATNSSGFTALAGGYRMYNTGSFSALKSSGRFWTSTSTNNLNAKSRLITSYMPTVDHGSIDKKNGHSVRCVKN